MKTLVIHFVGDSDPMKIKALAINTEESEGSWLTVITHDRRMMFFNTDNVKYFYIIEEENNEV